MLTHLGATGGRQCPIGVHPYPVAMSRSAAKVVSLVIVAALVGGIVLVSFSSMSSTASSTSSTTVTASGISPDPETNVRNACVDWAKIGQGSTSGALSAAEVATALDDMATLPDAAAARNPAGYGSFASSVHTMAAAFKASGAATVGTSVTAINAVCASPH